MRTTLTLCIIILASTLFAQTSGNSTSVTDITPNASTEIVIGFNNTSISARSTAITDTRNGNGFQVGLLRKHRIGNQFAFAFGMNILKSQHQLAFKERTIAYKDEGIRYYDNIYFRVPLEVTYSPKSLKSLFITGGFNIASALQNRSTETFIRIEQVDDAGARYEKPVEKKYSQYREVSPLDLGLRIGSGMKFNFNKMAFHAGLFYNQGLLNKDMGFRQGQFEVQLGMTLPRFKSRENDDTSHPVSWMN